jgi:hypothetical protein
MTTTTLALRAQDVLQPVFGLDWEDVMSVHRVTDPVLRRLAADKRLLGEMLAAVPHDTGLWSKCEEAPVEDKIVLWDDPASGFRVRLRMATTSQEEMAHQHRFSFTNLVLRGAVPHRNYTSRNGFDENTRADDLDVVCVHHDRPMNCFTIHHMAIHSTPLPELGTVSLVLRGPAAKDRAPVLFREERHRGTADDREGVEPEEALVGRMFWRVGEKDETPERRAERQMRSETYHAWCERLEAWGIVILP